MLVINKKERFYLLLAAFIWCGLVAVFTYGDLEFSQSLFDQNAGWAVWLERLGEFPGVLVAWMASEIILAYGVLTQKRDAGQERYIVVGIIAVTIFTLYIPMRLSYYFWDNQAVSFKKWLLMFTISGFTVIAIIKLISQGSLEEGKKIADKAMQALILFIIAIVAIHLLKGIWGRVRFRDMHGEYGLYTPWYTIQLKSSGNSFPSGHTSSAALTVLLIYILPMTKRWQRNMVVMVSVGYTLIVAFSRIVVGAHFFTDTLFGMAITYGIVLIGAAVMRRIWKKREKRQNCSLLKK